MRRPVLVVMAKLPRAGAVKTRLVPPLLPEEAAALAAAFLEDLATRLPAWGAEPVLALPDERAPSETTHWMELGFRIADQGPGNLGERLARVMQREAGSGRVVAVLGSDHPHIPDRAMGALLDHARRGGGAWITTDDGGFAAMSLPRAAATLLAGVPWSTPRVAETVRRRAIATGVELRDFGPWYDLDTAADLDRFLADPRSARDCPHTWERLQHLEPSWSARRGGHG